MVSAHNPYRPGAGLMPLYLAGRGQEIEEAGKTLLALKSGVPAKSMIYSGLRGVGKTVLLNRIEEVADEHGVLYAHLEIDAKSDFIPQIAAAAQGILRKISIKEQTRVAMEGALEALKSLVVSFDPDDNTFSLSVKEKSLYQTNSMVRSLTEVFLELGKVARKTKTPICFFIDEIQYMKKDELNALISALHRNNQLGHPIAMFGAGLPKVFQLMGDVKSYAERMFGFVTIDSLDDNEAKDAICAPAEEVGGSYTDDAVSEIIQVTQGYPYFIQEFCNVIWEKKSGDVVDKANVTGSRDVFYKQLDNGFFKVRFERCTTAEKSFLYAMVQCGQLPCAISQVAENMKREVSSISPLRAQLISKGFIYAAEHGLLDFTVPEFGAFLIRLEKN